MFMRKVKARLGFRFSILANVFWKPSEVGFGKIQIQGTHDQHHGTSMCSFGGVCP